MLSDESSNKDFALAYSQRFGDAANQIVTLMFGLAFAVYLALAGSADVRALLRLYSWLPWLLTGISAFGNGALIFVLYRLCFHEKRIVCSINSNENLIDSIQSAFEIRVGMLIFNTTLYLLAIWIVGLTRP
jgi:hypothetical protein